MISSEINEKILSPVPVISLENIFEKYTFQKRSCLPETSIDFIESIFNIKFPQDYKNYFLHHEGYEAFIGKEYVRFWSIDELKENNDGYYNQKWAPSFFGIGSNMGGDLIALESNGSGEYRVILTPFISMSKEDSIEIGNSFSDFLIRLDAGREWFDFLDETQCPK